jgi:hypothetical protein
MQICRILANLFLEMAIYFPKKRNFRQNIPLFKKNSSNGENSPPKK